MRMELFLYSELEATIFSLFPIFLGNIKYGDVMFHMYLENEKNNWTKGHNGQNRTLLSTSVPEVWMKRLLPK